MGNRQSEAGGGPTGSRPEYPMPCPGCRRIIDAREHLCPYCGIDTDKKLANARVVFMWVALGLFFLAAFLWRQCSS